MKKYVLIFMLSLFFGAFSAAQAATFQGNDSLSINAPVDDDLALTGKTVQINEPINGELIISARNVTITKKPARSIFVAADTITIDAGSGYNLFAAGNTVTVKGIIEHDAYITGKTVTIDPSTVVKGTLRIYASNVIMHGRVERDALIGAQTVESSATIGGTLKAKAETLTFKGGAIGKDLIYTSNRDAAGISAVTVGGKTERVAPSKNMRSFGHRLLLGILTALVSGAALILLMPKKLTDLSFMVKKEWGKSLLYGVVLLLAAPLLLVFIMSTIVGLPIGIIGLLLYGSMLYVSGIMAKILIGGYILTQAKVKTQNWWGALILGILVVVLLESLPVVGPMFRILFFIGALLPVLGATFLWWKNKLTA